MTVPSVEQEAARDLVRAREDARSDLMRARHRLSKLLLRQGHVYSGGQAWTGAHDVWLRRTGAQLGSAATRMTFESDYDAVLTVKARRDRLDHAITAMAADCEFAPLLRRLGCLRGIGTLTGFALAVEVGDWERFSGRVRHPDYVMEMPQTNERIRGRDAMRSMQEAFPNPPTITLRRVVGSGHVWVIEGVNDYDGDLWSIALIFELDDHGLIVRDTRYYGQRSEPPEWRSQWVERLQ